MPLRLRTVFLVLFFATVHFGLLVISIVSSLRLFTGPITAGEIFWDHVMVGLLLPTSLVFDLVTDRLGQTILMILNSLIWGGAFAFLVVQARKLRKA